MMRHLILVLFVAFFATLQSCDNCRNLDCLNGGECVDGRCECAEGYQGETCQQQERDKFLADFEATETCLFTNNPPPLQISAGDDISEINISGLYRYYSGTVTAVVNDAIFDIPAQDFGGSVISGSGELSSTTLTINYVIRGSGNYDECQVVAEKIF